MEGEAADHLFILLLCLHWDGTVVVQLKDLPVEEQFSVRALRISLFNIKVLFVQFVMCLKACM